MIDYRKPCWCLCSNGKKKLSADPSHLCTGRRDGTPYFHQFLQLLYILEKNIFCDFFCMKVVGEQQMYHYIQQYHKISQHKLS